MYIIYILYICRYIYIIHMYIYIYTCLPLYLHDIYTYVHPPLFTCNLQDPRWSSTFFFAEVLSLSLLPAGDPRLPLCGWSWGRGKVDWLIGYDGNFTIWAIEIDYNLYKKIWLYDLQTHFLDVVGLGNVSRFFSCRSSVVKMNAHRGWRFSWTKQKFRFREPKTFLAASIVSIDLSFLMCKEDAPSFLSKLASLMSLQTMATQGMLRAPIAGWDLVLGH